jgi:osmotically-inducible protein OsmY
MRSDSDSKRDVEDELRWTPDLGPTDIGVAVKNGVVTLTGFVRSYSQKIHTQAEEA